jgi:hypothetical protein
MSKGFFKVRRNAIIITVLIILLSTLFGVNRSLGERTMEVSDLFNEGVKSGGYTLKSIRSQLIIRAETALDMITVATNYEEAGDQTTELRAARNNLMDLLEKEASPSLLCAADKELDSAFITLYQKLSGLALTDSDAEIIDEDFARMKNAATVIEKSEYNSAVRDFRRKVLSVFPTNR